jgi:Cft2 family RNA processing exonuclease
MGSAHLIAVSGLGPKEPAAFVVEADGRRLLLDCGEGSEPGRLPDFDAIGNIHAVILSHGHVDHAGALRFSDRFGCPPVYATAPVLARLKGIAGHTIPMRGRTDVLGIAVETGTNGHAPGGVWLRLGVGEGLIYMGDHSTESQLYHFDVPPETATMIIDGSYGDVDETLEPQRRRISEILGLGPALLPVPPDGRGPDIAAWLIEQGFDVAIDEQVRSVAAMLMHTARRSARDEAIPGLQRLLDKARVLDGDAPAIGVMVAHGGSGDVGVADALIQRWQDATAPTILFTGHLPAGTTGRRLVEEGRALFQRWNVHPRISDNLALIERVNPKRIVPAFGRREWIALWQKHVTEREIVSSTPIEL